MNRLTSGGNRFRQLSTVSHFRVEASGVSGAVELEVGEVHGALDYLRVFTPRNYSYSVQSS